MNTDPKIIEACSAHGYHVHMGSPSSSFPQFYWYIRGGGFQMDSIGDARHTNAEAWNDAYVDLVSRKLTS